MAGIATLTIAACHRQAAIDAQRARVSKVHTAYQQAKRIADAALEAFWQDREYDPFFEDFPADVVAAVDVAHDAFGVYNEENRRLESLLSVNRVIAAKERRGAK